MGWTTLRTWTAGEVLTAANLNAQLRDNLTYLGDLAYVEFTATVNTTATTEATANQVVTDIARVYAATPILVEFFCPRVQTEVATGLRTHIVLFDGTTPLGDLAQLVNQAAAAGSWPVYAGRRFTPSAGSHTYNVRAWSTGGAGSVQAGAGGSGSVLMPGFLRIAGLVS